MTAPAIPDDVMRAARECAARCVERPYNKGSVTRAAGFIASAILAERQRCVEASERVAEENALHSPPAQFAALDVRDLIQGATT